MAYLESLVVQTSIVPDSSSSQYDSGLSAHTTGHFWNETFQVFKTWKVWMPKKQKYPVVCCLPINCVLSGSRAAHKTPHTKSTQKAQPVPVAYRLRPKGARQLAALRRRLQWT
jgi:hypothetical protein